MLTSLTYANADGTRTAIVARCDSGASLFLWSVTCRDYGQVVVALTGYLHFCQRVASQWVQQTGHVTHGRDRTPDWEGR